MPKKNNEPSRIPTCHPERKHIAKGLCKTCYDRERGSANRDRMNAKARAWAAKNPAKRLATKRKYLYGVEPAVVLARMNAQGGICKICQVAPAKEMDHDHKTGKPRGILCGNCNRGLGLFRDDSGLLRRAVEYLELWEQWPAGSVEQNTGRVLGESTRGL